MRLSSRLAVPKLVLAGSAALALLARQQQPTGGSPTIKVTTQLVQVNVVVHDHYGRPVPNLTQKDFEIKDAGKLQAIRVFRVDQPAPNPAGAAPAQALPKNFATNHPLSPTGESPSMVTVVLIDTYNTPLLDQAYAKKQLAKFLKTVRPEDQIAIYTLNSNGFGIVQDFTNNAERLEAALSKTKLRFSHQLDNSSSVEANTGNNTVDAQLSAESFVTASFFTRNRVLNTCAAFKSLADHLSGIPGRKNLVWLTGSVPISMGFGDPEDVTATKQAGGGLANFGAPDPSRPTGGGEANEPQMFADYLDEASRALNTANVAVYPVDARGLFGLPFADASKNVQIDPRTHRVPASQNVVDNRNTETMTYVADLTGGHAFYNTNDLAGAVRKAIDDSSVTYTLGYYVPEEEWDGKYHKIKVTVDRRDVKVRTKKGYLAQNKPALTEARLSEELRKALWSPLDSTELAVTARIDPSPVLPNASRLAFVLAPAEMQFLQQGDKIHGDFDVMFVQERKGGERVTDTKKNLKLGMTLTQFRAMAKSGMVLNEDLPIEPDTVAVKVIVLDRLSGALGSVTMSVEAADKSGANVVPALPHP